MLLQRSRATLRDIPTGDGSCPSAYLKREFDWIAGGGGSRRGFAARLTLRRRRRTYACSSAKRLNASMCRRCAFLMALCARKPKSLLNGFLKLNTSSEIRRVLPGDTTLISSSQHFSSICPAFGDSESALVLQPVPDLVEPLFTGPQRGGAGMHRVAAEHESVDVWSRRPKNELRIRLRMDVDRIIRRLEDRELAPLHFFRETKPSRAQRDPADRMIGGRVVAPGFAGPQPHRQVIQRDRRLDRTRRPAVSPNQHTRRTVARDDVRFQVDVFHGPELLIGRQRDPELKAARTAGVASSPAVPGSVRRLEPFHPAREQDSGRSTRIFVTDASLEQVRHRRDA